MKLAATRFSMAALSSVLLVASSSSRSRSAWAFAPTTVTRDTAVLGMMGSIFDLLGGKAGGGGLVAPGKALKGRPQKMANIDNLRHRVLGNLLVEVPAGYQEAVYASGCFWGSEKGQWRFPRGIHSTAVGYCAGYTPNPTYEEACSGQTGHTEGVRVVYDPTLVSFADILRWFWESHDPTSGLGQGNDRGSQYRSGFYYYNSDQRQLIDASKTAYQKALAAAGRSQPITTEIASAADYEMYGGLWNYAEPYHQQYLASPGARPYCSAQPQGVSLPPYDEWCPFPKGSQLYETHRPTLPDSFWAKYGSKRGCSIIQQPNDPIAVSSF